MGYPGFVAGAHFGRNAGIFQRQVFDQSLTDRGLKFCGKLLAADQARAIELEIEVGKDVARLQATCPLFQRIEMSCGKGSADHGSDRGADDDVGNDAVRDQRLDDANMGKTARGPPSERQPDYRPPAAGLAGGFPVVMASADPVQHGGSDLLSAQAGYREKAAPARLPDKHGLCRGWGWDCAVAAPNRSS